MTERIQEIIDGIRLKTKALYHQLKEERDNSKSLLAEIQTLQETEKGLKVNEVVYLKEISDLKMALEMAKSQVVEVSAPFLGKKDEEIDELVKEIEYCISQLKK